jgi:hypothetical protein
VLRAEYELDTGVITNMCRLAQVWAAHPQRHRFLAGQDLFESDTRTQAGAMVERALLCAADLGRASLTVGAYIFHQNLGYDEDRAI